MKSEIITIAGALGSGKSSTAKLVASALGYSHFSSGDLFRAVAKERGLTIEEINKVAELEVEIDHAVDERLQQMADESKFVIDSRMAYHWIPNSFKVYLDLEPHAAAERIYNHIKKEGRLSQEAESIEQLLEATQERQASEKKRYLSLYQVNVEDLSVFDAVIDTGPIPLVGVGDLIVEKYKNWLAN
jgi:cytidylate kinase